MSRPKGSKNKVRQLPAEQFSFSTKQRLELVADLIVEMMIEDQRNGKHLINVLEGTHATTTSHKEA